MFSRKKPRLRVYVTLENRSVTSRKTKVVTIALPFRYSELLEQIAGKLKIDGGSVEALKGYHKQQQTYFDIEPNDVFKRGDIDPDTIIYVSLKPKVNQNVQTARTPSISSNGIDETINSLIDFQMLSNPYIILNGISDYSKSKPPGKWQNLGGVIVDVKSMITLWSGIYGYNDMSVSLPNYTQQTRAQNNDSNENNENKENKENKENEQEKDYGDSVMYAPTAMANRESYNDFLVSIRATIDSSKCNDGLIYYYSGHGVKNGIILEDGKRFPIKQIFQIFNGEQCVLLRNKPKIMIFDSCRGSEISGTYNVYFEAKEQAVTKGPNTAHEWIDSKFHANSGLATIFSNFEDYSINDSDYGGCLTRAIFKLFSNPQSVAGHSLRDLIIAIRRQTKIYSGRGNVEWRSSSELVDFHETLEYKVYFEANINNDRSIEKANQTVMDEIEELKENKNQDKNKKRASRSGKNLTQLQRLIIGSWNVHRWGDVEFAPNIDSIIQSLESTPCDLLSIQDSTFVTISNKAAKEIESAKAIRNNSNNKLKYTCESWIKNESSYVSTVKLFGNSKCKILQTYTCSDLPKPTEQEKIYPNKDRIQLNIVEFMLNSDSISKGEDKDSIGVIKMGVFCVQLNLRSESIRMSQLSKIKKLKKTFCDKIDNNMAIIILGSFNSLRKLDYSNKKWKEIHDIRQKNNWELPMDDVTSTIEKWGFIDCLNYLRLKTERERKRERKRTVNLNESDDMDSKNNNRNNKLGMELEDLDIDNEKWTNVIDGKVATCRYDTRIDFVFCNKYFYKVFDVVKVEHLTHNNASTHALVRVHCEY